MKKIIFTILLTIVSSVWTTSMALCLSPIPDAVYQPFATVSGTFVSVPIPCEPIDEYPCPACLTLALQTSDRLYYLTADNADIQTQLEAIEYQLSLTTNITGSVSGTPYTEESYEYIRVQAVDTNSTPLRLPSLCDEWNVWYESFQSFGPINYNAVIKYRLATDTMINGQRYVQLAYDNSPYMEGALREGSNRDIYYIPSRSTHEYLLYAFNAQVGDTITNLYVGAMGKEEGYQAVVRAISDSNPRIFTVGVNIDEYTEYSIKWIEGVGSPETPCGLAVVPPSPADVGTYSLLCAYNNGEQVYVSEMGKQYGCEYNQTPLLPSLCDEWNIAKISNVTGPDEEIHTVKAFLGSDTIIESQNYVKLIEDSKYKGAMREGESGVIYYIPAGSAHEYLLYNFNAQVGDKLTNLWYGGRPEWCPNGYNATVLSISDETPRVFTVEVEFIITDSEGEHIIPLLVYWTEGVGLSDGPAGRFCPGPACACSCGQVLLCAYKNGEHIYTSDFGEQYGCEYNYDPFAPSDTIPLYIKDGPGSSTVEPVDPNEIIAKLILDELQMKEYLHTIIDYNLTKAPAANSSPAVKHVNPVVAADSFTDSETVTLTESGRYFLEMSHPDWDYTIVGTFVYNALQGLETIENSQSACTKELREGQLLIRQGEQLYTPTGIRIQ